MAKKSVKKSVAVKVNVEINEVEAIKVTFTNLVQWLKNTGFTRLSERVAICSTSYDKQVKKAVLAEERAAKKAERKANAEAKAERKAKAKAERLAKLKAKAEALKAKIKELES